MHQTSIFKRKLFKIIGYERSPLSAAIFFLRFFSTPLFSQGVAINTDGSSADASAMLDVKSSVRGILIPRMTSVQRTAIASPVQGLQVFDITTKSLWHHTGTGWAEVTSSGNNPWQLSSPNVYTPSSINTGIGTGSTVKAKLHVLQGGTVLFGDDTTAANGSRLYFCGTKTALRVGRLENPGINTDAFDYANIGDNSGAFGKNNKVAGSGAFAAGNFNTAAGEASQAFGTGNTARDINSFAGGNSSSALGQYAFSFGNSLHANSYNAAAFGAFNDTSVYANASKASWVVNDPLLIIGNGSSAGTRGNAMVVAKGGAIGVNIMPDQADVFDGLFTIKEKNSKMAFSIQSQFNTSSAWGLFINSANTLMMYYNTVNVGNFNNSTGAYTTISDLRFKKDIQPMNSVLDGVLQLRPCTYRMLTEGETSPLSTGFIAQEVLEVFPNTVHKITDNVKGGERYNLNYADFGVLAIKAIQEQQVTIKNQEIKISELEERIKKIEEKIK